MFSVRSLARRLCDSLVASRRRPPSPPRPPSTASFLTIDPSLRIEEETLEWYNPNDFYPVQIGEVFQSRYQVIGKLGHGAYSTAWLCRDLVEHRYVAVKICTRNSVPVRRELASLNHLNSLPRTRHLGRGGVRTLLDQFEITSEPAAVSSQSNDHASDTRPFQCLVHKPMLMSLFAFRMSLRKGMYFSEVFLKAVLCEVLHVLDYLHTEAKMVHTDIQERNILLGLDDVSPLEKFEEEERTNPSPRKVADGRTIYLSRKIRTPVKKYGRPVICDFGEARFGSKTYTGDIQPYQYRAPEVILGMPWNEKVDIWSLGVMIWDMFDGKNMFNTKGGPNNEDDNLYHLAHMVSLLGPPPVDFLKRSETDEPWKYFDMQGNWIGATSLPDDSLEQSEKILEGEAKARLLRVVRKMVTWRPEDRHSAKELLDDEWFYSA